MTDLYFVFLLAMSLVTFFLYGMDKRRAQKDKWRVPERALLGCSLFGGAVGGFLAMQLFRHKTKHFYFYIVNLAGIALHLLLAFILVMNV